VEVEVAEGNRIRLAYLIPPLFYLAVFVAPYIILLAQYGIVISLDSYTAWVFAFTVVQALLSAVLALGGAFLILPAYLKAPWLKPVLLIPFFAPAISTVDALIRIHGDVMFSMWGIIIAHGVYYAPYAALIIESNVRSIPADIIDAMELYVKRRWAKLRILTAELKPSILYSFYAVFVFSFLSFTTPLLLGGRYPTLELLVYIYATSFASTNAVSALVAITLLTSLAMAVPFFRLPQPPSAEQAPRPVKIGFFPLAVAALASAYYIAVGIYIFQPLSAPRAIGDVLQPLVNSVLVAFTSATLSIVVTLSFLAADAAGNKISILTYVATLSLSKTLFALGFFHLAQPLYGTLLILTLAHALVISPLAYSLVKPAWEKIRQDVKEACVLYLGPYKCISRIVTEALGPTLVQTWLFAFASSLSETTLALMLTTGGASTLSATTARLLISRAPDFIETGHFYSSLLALIVLATLAASRLIKTRPYSF